MSDQCLQACLQTEKLTQSEVSGLGGQQVFVCDFVSCVCLCALKHRVCVYVCVCTSVFVCVFRWEKAFSDCLAKGSYIHGPLIW